MCIRGKTKQKKKLVQISDTDINQYVVLQQHFFFSVFILPEFLATHFYNPGSVYYVTSLI